MENIDIDLSQVEIQNVDSVLTGPQGPPGYSPTANVSKTGNVTTITITDEDGTTTAQILDGTDGQNGQNNTLTIGTVSSGANPSATITGESPSQVLNLVLPKGDAGANGQDGITPTVSVGTTITVPYGNPATVNNSGSNTNVILDFQIPQGPQGDDANCLSIPTLVNSLPETGVGGIFYFVPKTYTSSTLSGTTINVNLTDNSGQVTDAKVYGDLYQASTPSVDSPITMNVVTGTQTITVTDADSESTTYSIRLGSIELCAIGNDKDYIYRNNDNWYVHRVNEKMIADSNTSVSSVNTALTNVSRCFIVPPKTPSSTTTAVKSNKFITNAGWNTDQEQTYLSNGTNIMMFINQSRGVTDVESCQTWLGNNNPVWWYTLATPEDIQITDDDLLNDLNELANLQFSSDVTIVVSPANDVTASLDIDYYSYDIHNMYDKYVWMPETNTYERIGS